MTVSKIAVASILLGGIFLLDSCAGKNAPDNMNINETESEVNFETVSEGDFNDYWYAGDAEISSYTLSQARYGEMHQGNEILVFVTEDYNMDKQVKKEMNSDAATASVLKLNRIKRFTTGIYDYSMMSSVFKAVDYNKYPRSFKINSSSQDWCGHTWANLVWDDKSGYSQYLDSYFEAEVGIGGALGKAMSEDEIFNQIRLDPTVLPKGKFRMIPSMNYSRFSHNTLKAEEVSGTLSLEKNTDGVEVSTYTLEYTSGRTLKIYFGSNFPYQIKGWEEKRKSGFGAGAKWLTTIGTLNKSIKSNYWSKNSVADKNLRKELGL